MNRLLSLIVASGAATGIAATVSSADGGGGARAAVDASTPKLQLAVATFDTERVQGIVSVAQRGRRPRVKLSVSLHGPVSEARHRLVGSSQRCAKRASRAKQKANVADVAFSLNFEEIIDRVVLEDIVVLFGTPTVPMSGSLTAVKSVGIYTVGPAGRSKVACAPVARSTAGRRSADK